MSSILKVKPKEGLKVRDPETKCHISEEGTEVFQTNYWLRRLQCGDVELIKEHPVSEEKKMFAMKTVKDPRVGDKA